MKSSLKIIIHNEKLLKEFIKYKKPLKKITSTLLELVIGVIK